MSSRVVAVHDKFLQRLSAGEDKKRKRPLRQLAALLVPVAALLHFSSSAIAGGIQDDNRARSETVYVPAYAHIHTHQKIRQALASTLVVHNVDP